MRYSLFAKIALIFLITVFLAIGLTRISFLIDERTAQLSRFRVSAKQMETTSLSVKLEQLTDQTVALAQLSNEQIGFYLRSKVISKGVTDALEKIVAMRVDFDANGRVARIDAQASQRPPAKSPWWKFGG